MENKTGKYFKYAIGEIILVVIGILIALQINNWNERNKLNELKQSYYQQLLEDLNKDKLYIKKQIIDFESSRDEYNLYLETYKKPNLTTEESIDNLLSVEFISVILSFQTNSIESLENTGDIKLIPLIVRNSLIDLKKIKDKTAKIAFTNDEHKSNLLEKVTEIVGGPTLMDRLKNQKELSAFLKPEENYHKLFLLYEAAQAWRNQSELTTLKALKTIQDQNDSVIELIEGEMKK